MLAGDVERDGGQQGLAAEGHPGANPTASSAWPPATLAARSTPPNRTTCPK